MEADLTKLRGFAYTKKTLFGIKPRCYRKQAGLRVMFFNGKEKAYRARLDTVFDAPMVGRWQVDEGLVEKFSSLVKP